jgi:hypothetical protein
MQRIGGGAGIGLTVLSVLLGLILLASTTNASPGVTMTVNTTWNNYPAGINLDGVLDLVFDDFIPSNAYLDAFIDGNQVSSNQVIGLLPTASNYSFPPYSFTYDLTTSGSNSWKDFPTQDFDYSIKVQGMCGDGRNESDGGCCYLDSIPPSCFCDCGGFCGDQYDPSSFPCNWEVSYPQGWRSSTVRGNDGLKPIDDFSVLDQQGLPGGRNEPDTLWLETTNTDPTYPGYNANVTTTMRKACGGDSYETHYVSFDGWVHSRALNPTGWVLDGAHRYSNIEKFDNTSLSTNRGLYVDRDIGGIYKDGKYLVYNETEMLDGAFWNGTDGYIKIYFYDDSVTYTITYLPPNGPKLCAYTDYYTGDAADWSEIIGPYNEVTSYSNPVSRQHDMSDFPLGGQPKPCPPITSNCTQGNVTYGALLTNDPSNTVSLNLDSATRTLTGSTSSRIMSNNYTESIGLEQLTNIKATSQTNHGLRIDLMLNGQLLASVNQSFGICSDSDGDGYCSIAEGGGDCDDLNEERSPGLIEECNGEDDDCDGIADDGIFLDNKELGSYCGGPQGTKCIGTWRCSDDKTTAVCEFDYQPGDLLEICENDVDDDCDGDVDELMNLTGDPACWCDLKADPLTCGSPVGICRPGTRYCEMSDEGYPEWSVCRGSVNPKTETCNRDDDDCDGTIDDVNSGNSISSSKCGCYDGLSPTPETCNEIDDDCDGEIDNGISCCTDGDTRACGSDEGACEKGTQTCKDGSWQSLCVDEVEPAAEICYNNMDDDCDGQRDEGCDPEYSCTNGIQDLNEAGVDCGGPCPTQCMSGPFWMIIAGVAILVLLGVWLLVMKQKV